MKCKLNFAHNIKCNTLTESITPGSQSAHSVNRECQAAAAPCLCLTRQLQYHMYIECVLSSALLHITVLSLTDVNYGGRKHLKGRYQFMVLSRKDAGMIWYHWHQRI